VLFCKLLIKNAYCYAEQPRPNSFAAYLLMTDVQIQEMLMELEHQYAELMAADAPMRVLSGLWSQILYFRDLMELAA
jgi:hypothetical protein